MRSTTKSTAPTAGHLYSPGAIDSLERAAARLGEDPERLRDRCERAAEECSDIAVAHLGGGVVALKTDGSWRFRFPIVRGDKSSPGAGQ